MNGASNALTRSGSVPSLDLKSFLPSNAEDEQVMDTTHQVAIVYNTSGAKQNNKRSEIKSHNLFTFAGGILGMEAVHGELRITVASSCKYIYNHYFGAYVARSFKFSAGV